MKSFRAVAIAIDALFRPWRYYARFDALANEAIEPDPRAHLLCGVPDCGDGRVVFDDGKWALVDCDPHNAVTRHESSARPPKEQQVIRVQDAWRQHGVSKPPR